MSYTTATVRRDAWSARAHRVLQAVIDGAVYNERMRKRFVASALAVIVGAIWWHSGGSDAAGDEAPIATPQRDAHAVVNIARAVRVAPRLAVQDVAAKLREALDEPIDGLETVDESPHGRDDGSSSSISGEVVFEGKLRDGVVVVARVPGIAEEWVVLTDERGRYRINGVPAGEVVVTFWVDDRSAEHSFILGASSDREIDHDFKPVPPGITDDYTRYIPTSRTFGDVLGAAAGAQPCTDPDTGEGCDVTITYESPPARAACIDPDTGEVHDCDEQPVLGKHTDDLGVTFSGVTTLENHYIVEGVPVVENAGAGDTSLENSYLVEGIE